MGKKNQTYLRENLGLMVTRMTGLRQYLERRSTSPPPPAGHFSFTATLFLWEFFGVLDHFLFSRFTHLQLEVMGGIELEPCILQRLVLPHHHHQLVTLVSQRPPYFFHIFWIIFHLPLRGLQTGLNQYLERRSTTGSTGQYLPHHHHLLATLVSQPPYFYFL